MVICQKAVFSAGMGQHICSLILSPDKTAALQINQSCMIKATICNFSLCDRTCVASPALLPLSWSISHPYTCHLSHPALLIYLNELSVIICKASTAVEEADGKQSISKKSVADDHRVLEHSALLFFVYCLLPLFLLLWCPCCVAASCTSLATTQPGSNHHSLVLKVASKHISS